MEITGEYRLIAYDPETAFEPKKVEFLKTLSCGERMDLVWARPNPSFDPPVFDSGDLIVLQTRHVGCSLLNTKYLPLHVYICSPKNYKLRLADEIEVADISIKAWGLLLDIDDERNDVGLILSGKSYRSS